MAWGIPETAREQEKIKAEMADHLNGLNATGTISYSTYSELFDLSMTLLDRMYATGRIDEKGGRDMVTREKLSDWLKEGRRKSDRQRAINDIEAFIDKAIEFNVKEGMTTFNISTGREGRNAHHKTPFYRLWYPDYVEDEDLGAVRQHIIDTYRKAGFDVRIVKQDCGFGAWYTALRFVDVHKVVDEEASRP